MVLKQLLCLFVIPTIKRNTDIRNFLRSLRGTILSDGGGNASVADIGLTRQRAMPRGGENDKGLHILRE